MGREYPTFSVTVEREHLLNFCAAIDEGGAIHRNPDAARATGYPDIVAPPTYAFTLCLLAGQSFNVLDDMGIPHANAVHGSQRFVYHAPLCAGDDLVGRQRIVDLYERKGGALLFIEVETPLRRKDGTPVVTLGSTIIVR